MMNLTKYNSIKHILLGLVLGDELCPLSSELSVVTPKL